MKPTSTTIALAAAALLLSTATAGAAESTVKRIIRGSVDGERTYYTVSCLDGSRASLFVEHKSEKTCAVPRNGTPKCKKDGLLRDVAEQACKAPQRG